MSKENEIDEFLNKFNEMTDTFGKTAELNLLNDSNANATDTGENLSNSQNHNAVSRLDRLQRSKSKAKNGLSAVKENLTKNYYSNPDTPHISDEHHESSRFRDRGTEENPNIDYSTPINYFTPMESQPDTNTSKEGAPTETKMEKKRMGSKKQKSDNDKKSRKKKILKGFLIAILAIATASIAFLAFIIITAEPINSENIYSRLSENSIMYDDEGKVIDNIVSLDGLRTNVSYTDLPQDLVDAIVAIEDKTFWDHNGFNFVRILGAIKESIFDGGSVSGTSTITQQLARNIYLVEQKTERSMDRKLREAYYTVLLEKHLSKEQILEAYLNTISLGFNTNGVQAASQAYFSKDVAELTLPECASIASLPQAPGRTALIHTVPLEQISAESADIIFKTDEWAYVYNDSFVDRKNLVLQFMKDQSLISQSEYNDAVAYDMRTSINPGEDATRELTSYFADYVIEEVIKDLEESLNLSTDEARNKVYSGGLRIHTSMNSNMQNIVETEFSKNSNFPSVYTRSSGNILNKDGQIMLYDYNNYFDSNGNFTLSPDEFTIDSDGNIIIYKDKRLKFFDISAPSGADINIEFNDMYIRESGTLYGIKGGIIQIDAKYKSKDSEGNVVISPLVNADFPNTINTTGGKLVISSEHYTLRQKTVQPQSSMVILDYKNGEIKAMVGGRGLEGRFLYNRADKPRQPGSSMKPIGAYGPALQASVDQLNGGPQAVTDKTQVYGAFWTAASSINDAPIKLPSGKMWPKNWYSGYKGLNRMRVAIEQSINTTAVKTFNDIGAERAIKFAKGLGVTSIVEKGAINDLNPSAMALGGMTYGISPLEMAGAYGTFANAGTYVSPSSYTQVTNKKGEIILEPTHESTQAMDKGAAFIMTDMLRSAVNIGIAGKAALPNQPVAGKTGTTNDNYDAWFVGYTPQYVGSVWIGNDVNLELSQGSIAATAVWNKVMRQVHANIPAGKFVKPDNVISATVDAFTGHLPSGGGTVTEYFVQGTQPKSTFKGSYPSGAGKPQEEETTPEEELPPATNTENGDPVTPPSGGGNNGILPPPVIDQDGGTGTNPGETPTPQPDNPDLPPSWITTE